MAPRASWKGYIKLSLVSCPVRLYPATSTSERITFNQLHKDTHNRINMKPVDPERGLVERSDLVKGYEYAKGRYVTMEDADFDNVRLETSEAIRLVEFVDADQLPALYVERGSYLAPDGKVAGEAYAVLREAMQGKVGIGKLVRNQFERTCHCLPAIHQCPDHSGHLRNSILLCAIANRMQDGDGK